ncbi:MAG TPA: hypothetical protein VII56_22350 [Rhizomicrobium sp.]
MTSVNFSAPVVSAAVSGPAPVPPAASTDESGFSFGDLLDIVNPLQHIPVVSTLYRAITGDTIKTFPKIAGDLLFGGVEGFASSVADTVFTQITGKSVGDTVLAFAENVFSPSSAPASTAVATAAAPAAPATASISAPVGEDLGDRIVDWVENLFSSSASGAGSAAGAAPPPSVPAVMPIATSAPALLCGPVDADADSIVVPGQDALFVALNRNGVGQDVALRAADAYRRTLNVAGTAAATALH